LALAKCDFDSNSTDDDFEQKKWEELAGLLDKVFTMRFPAYRKEGERLVPNDSSTLKEQWRELAEEYGLGKYNLDVDPRVGTRILDDYDS
jgi:hypothetical protein